MQIAVRFSDYLSSDFGASEFFAREFWSELEQLWLIGSADRVIERPKREFLVIGRPDVDGIEFGYLQGRFGIWAYYSIEDDFALVAPSVSAIVEGWLSGNISI